jgi:hypothetical protein
MNRRTLVVASRIAAAAGLSLALAGALTPAGTTAVTAAPTTTADLRQLLNPSGIEPIDPAEEMAAQQAFGARHYGALGLASPVALSTAIEQGIQQSTAMPKSTQFSSNWTLRGPKTYHADDPARSGDLTKLGFHTLSGRVTSLATTPRRPGLVWVGTAGGGVWRSTDQGRTWSPRFDKQGAIAIGSVAIDPSDASRVYVGTGEANTNADAYYGNGLYVTNDDGKTWRHVHLPGVLTVFHLEVAKPSPGFPKGRVFAATNNGLWLSTDHGKTYRNVSLPTNAAHNGVYRDTPFGNFVTDVRVRPHQADEVVAVVGWRRGSATEPDGKPDSVGNGFYASTKSGAAGTFAFVPQDPVSGLGVPNNNANSATPSSDPIGRTSLAYSADGKYLWAVVQDAGNFDGEIVVGGPLPASNSVLNGVYVSTTGDPGKNWVPKGNSQVFGTAPGSGLLIQQADLYGPGVQSWYDQWIAVDPSDDSRVLVGLEEVYEAIANQTAPAGMATWRTVSRYWNGCALLSNVDCSTIPGPTYAGDTTHPDQHAVAFVPLQGGTSLLYTGSDGGVFSQVSHQSDGYDGYDNSHWNYRNAGLATTQPYYAVEGSDGTIYAGLQDNGEVKVEPGSTRGDEVFGGDGFDTAVVPGQSTSAYEEYTYGDIAVSTDGGHNWRDIEPGDASSTNSQFAAPFMLDPRNANHIVAVGRYIDESTAGTGTQNWTTTYDLGASRVSTKPGVSGGGVNNIATAISVSGAQMYVPFCGLCDPISQGAGNFHYFHNGLATNVKSGCAAATGSSTCWHKATVKGLPNRYIQGVAMDPVHPRTVYVALSGYLRHWYPNDTRSGPVWVSHDAGQTFHNISGNLPRVPGNALVVRNGRVFVGTDRGIYSARQSSSSPRRTHWTRVGRGLPNASVLDLRLNPQGSQLVAATHGRGVWTYNFGHQADKPYRQRGAMSPTPAAPSPPTAAPTPAVDPALLGSGLGLLLVAVFAQVVARRRRLLPA